MSPLEHSSGSVFVIENAEKLTRYLGKCCARAATEIVEVLKERMPDQLPEHVDEDSVFILLLTLRALIETNGVRNRFGQRAFDTLLGEMNEIYTREILDGKVSFVSLIAEAQEAIKESLDPREWPRLYSMKVLKTKEPTHWFFHQTLAYGFSVGEPIAKVVEKNI